MPQLLYKATAALWWLLPPYVIIFNFAQKNLLNKYCMTATVELGLFGSILPSSINTMAMANRKVLIALYGPAHFIDVIEEFQKKMPREPL